MYNAFETYGGYRREVFVSEGIRITVPAEVALELLELVENSMGANMDRSHAEENELPWFDLINRLRMGIDKRQQRFADALCLPKPPTRR